MTAGIHPSLQVEQWPRDWESMMDMYLPGRGDRTTAVGRPSPAGPPTTASFDLDATATALIWLDPWRFVATTRTGSPRDIDTRTRT